MTVATEYSLADGDRHLALTTWVTGGGGIQPISNWGTPSSGAPATSTPPVTDSRSSGTTVQAWMAGLASDVCYAYAGTAGDCWGPNGKGWSDLNVTTETLDPVLPVSYTRYLAVADGEIAAAVSILHDALGVPTGSVICNVRSQADGSLLAGALVDVFDGSGSPQLQMVVDGDGPGLCQPAAGRLAGAGQLLGISAGGDLADRLSTAAATAWISCWNRSPAGAARPSAIP